MNRFDLGAGLRPRHAALWLWICSSLALAAPGGAGAVMHYEAKSGGADAAATQIYAFEQPAAGPLDVENAAGVIAVETVPTDAEAGEPVVDDEAAAEEAAVAKAKRASKRAVAEHRSAERAARVAEKRAEKEARKAARAIRSAKRTAKRESTIQKVAKKRASGRQLGEGRKRR